MQPLKSLVKYKSYPIYQGMCGTIPVRTKNMFFGVEVELEGVPEWTRPPTWKAMEDHSLKINGQEFASIPLKLQYLEMELSRLFNGVGKPLITSRCSIHVHMNVRDLTWEEVFKLILIYLFFEKSLFKYSGDRFSNNFCVPLFECPSVVSQLNPKNTGVEWYKYLALNILPIWGKHGESNCLGTIEFRHMAGTTDVRKIVDWCNLLAGIKLAAKRFPLDELIAHLRTMNTTSGYYWFAKEVFKDWSKLVTGQETFKEDVESCILRTKFSFRKLLNYKEALVEKKDISITTHYTNKSIGEEYLNSFDLAQYVTAPPSYITTSTIVDEL